MRDLPPLFDTDSVRRFEAAAIAAVGDESILMERAGQAAWHRVLELWPAARRLLVVCGAGGNGGDGFVLARLAHASSREVSVVEYRPTGSTHAAACAARDAYVGAGARLEAWAGTLPAADVVIDALFGIGLSREPRAEAAALIDAINIHGAPVLALDVPSGVDSRGVAGSAVRASSTLEFLLPKAVLRTGPALAAAGAIAYASLDVPAAVEMPDPSAHLASVAALSRWLHRRGRDSHKGDNGRVACIGGDHGSGGAVLLCAEGALRAGAGLVRVHTRDAHVAPLLARLPEAMATPETEEFDAAWPDVVVIGPGLGQGNWGFAHLHHVVDSDVAAVLDADALNLLARHAFTIRSPAVLTPHPGEAARLLGISSDAVQRDRIGAAVRIAQERGAVVVLKGAGTIVCAPGGVPVILDAGNPGMAVGGMGDLLAGVIAALRAQGLSAFDAACCGALLHSAAGDVAAHEGERGLLPTDLLPALRRLANPA
ncbi:NAD(P)H-hydrate dehydratase [Lysobacter sp. TY2-98]|uniref:NAD(P)H-hydrate dehydratase n=1 Tax=Lysobacter sp. TY2-98 TaxID=2290922 RepID=UPI000E202191|nr:NAD(P)H-hydrate dehydratase [Lysobacter sp. TY2-98]AXK71954.1 NAD(P)H-hydrate dehydratase [Lysobacter sp. TY2-98]